MYLLRSLSSAGACNGLPEVEDGRPKALSIFLIPSCKERTCGHCGKTSVHIHLALPKAKATHEPSVRGSGVEIWSSSVHHQAGRPSSMSKTLADRTLRLGDHLAMGQFPVPPVNMPIPTKIGSKMGGAPTPKRDPIGFDPQPFFYNTVWPALQAQMLTPKFGTARSRQLGVPVVIASPCQGDPTSKWQTK